MTLSSYKFYAFKLWCWRRLLRIPWTARRSNQSILNEINPEYSLEGLMLKVKLQEFGHLMWRADSLEKTLMLGKTDRRRRGQQRIRWVDGIINSMNMNMSSSKLQEVVKDSVGQWMELQRFRQDWLNNNKKSSLFYKSEILSRSEVFPLNIYFSIFKAT